MAMSNSHLEKMNLADDLRSRKGKNLDTKKVKSQDIIEQPPPVLFMHRYYVFARITKKSNVFTAVDTHYDENFDDFPTVVLKLLPPSSSKKLRTEKSVYEKIENHVEEKGLRLQIKEKHINFAKLLHSAFTEFSKFNYLSITEEGDSLEILHMQKGQGFSRSTLCLIAVRAIDLLQILHEISLIHRDIHPGNFVVNGKLKSEDFVLTLIDFRATGRYKVGSVLKPQEHNAFRNGSMRSYCTGKHEQRTLSRKDDMEALGLMLLNLRRKILPWLDKPYLKFKNDTELKKEFMAKRRINRPLEEMCSDLPTVFKNFIEYSRNLDFEEEPDYNLWRSEFQIEFYNQIKEKAKKKLESLDQE